MKKRDEREREHCNICIVLITRIIHRILFSRSTYPVARLSWFKKRICRFLSKLSSTSNFTRWNNNLHLRFSSKFPISPIGSLIARYAKKRADCNRRSAIKKEEERSLLGWNESGRTANNNGRYVIDMGSTVMYIGQAIAKGSGILREGSIV